ncbi:MAG: hypothetical protein MI757_09210 [Pirellulales bacterium]|nr:hypothetical protein [Pirellulales bacterium]
MVSAVRSLKEHFSHNNELTIEFTNPEDADLYTRYVEMLDQGIVMQKTLTARTPKAFALSMKPHDGEGGCLLYLYDAAGEDFEDEQSLATHPIGDYDGLVLTIDPLAEPGVREAMLDHLSPDELLQANAAPVSVSDVIGRLVGVLERAHGNQITKPLDIPLAVVTTKMDVGNLDQRIGMHYFADQTGYYNMKSAAFAAQANSTRIWDFLERVGLGNALRIIDSRFSVYAAFGVSALGRSAKGSDRSCFSPKGVLAPMLWLLFHTNAHSDSDDVDRWFVNLHQFLARSFTGKNGWGALLLSWALLAAICTLVTVAFLLFDTTAVLLLGGIQLMALPLIYLFTYLVLIQER